MTDIELTKAAEQLFYNNQSDLMKFSTGLWSVNKSEKKIEGEDINRGFVFPAFFGANTGNYTIKTGGRAEIKAARHFLNRNGNYSNNVVEKSGVIGFEIFGIWDADRGIPYAGWTLALYNPEQLNAIKRLHNDTTTATKPDVLAFILYDEKEIPFACVAFEDITKLIGVLDQCFPTEWNFNYFNLPSLADKKYWGKYIDDKGRSVQWDPDKGGMIKNMWYVPFRTLARIATVTMIGNEDPIIDGESNGVSKGLQELRLNCLKQAARDAVQINEETGEKLKYRERRLTIAKQEQNRIARENGRTPVTFYIAKQITSKEIITNDEK